VRVNLTVNGSPHRADDVWEGESLLYVLRERLGLPGSKNACEQGECGSCTVRLDGVPVCACLVAAGQAEGREVVTVEGLADLAGRRAGSPPAPVPAAGRFGTVPAAESTGTVPAAGLTGPASAAGPTATSVTCGAARDASRRPPPDVFAPGCGGSSNGGAGRLAPIQQAFLDAGAVQCGFCTPGLLVAADELLERHPRPTDADIREALAGNLCRCTGYEKILDAVRLAAARTSKGA
jgi:aerobic carbon-monoxide dehydrogenase small subunit